MKAGTPQKEIARRLNVTPNTVSRWCNEIRALIQTSDAFLEAEQVLLDTIPAAAKAVKRHVDDPNSPKNYEAARDTLRGHSLLRDRSEVQLSVPEQDEFNERMSKAKELAKPETDNKIAHNDDKA